ncbi:cyclin pho80 [Trichoderma arundinaceum]|uniref:Cyclin pho80 n=1 Tax=Trichoderma arundinaceum TaxID=490622 RepID=A0A395NK62_TRIAR|nr:cyclin pho80 [Trichoderma arundinaceum]
MFSAFASLLPHMSLPWPHYYAINKGTTLLHGMSLLASQPTFAASGICNAQALFCCPFPKSYNPQEMSLIAGEGSSEWIENPLVYRHGLPQNWVPQGLGPQPKPFFTAAHPATTNFHQQRIEASHHAIPYGLYYPPDGGLGSLLRGDFGLPAHHGSRILQRVGYDENVVVGVAVQMTCLFWFSSVDELKAAETTRSMPPPPQLPPPAIPGNRFRQEVLRVVHAAGLKRNDVYLALLLIYRKRMMTRLAQPQIGRENDYNFELLCTALILSHKGRLVLSLIPDRRTRTENIQPRTIRDCTRDYTYAYYP